MADVGDLAEAVDLRLFRNTPPPIAALETSEKALSDGRGHRKSEPAPIYGSEDSPTADAEFLHHHPYFSGSTIRQTELHGRLLVLDVLQDGVEDALNVATEDLVRETDWHPCQELAGKLFASGVQALRLPSVRNAGGTNLIIERSAGVRHLREAEIVYRVIEKP